jgi:hypothetical protein
MKKITTGKPSRSNGSTPITTSLGKTLTQTFSVNTKSPAVAQGKFASKNSRRQSPQGPAGTALAAMGFSGLKIRIQRIVSGLQKIVKSL